MKEIKISEEKMTQELREYRNYCLSNREDPDYILWWGDPGVSPTLVGNQYYICKPDGNVYMSRHECVCEGLSEYGGRRPLYNRLKNAMLIGVKKSIAIDWLSQNGLTLSQNGLMLSQNGLTLKSRADTGELPLSLVDEQGIHVLSIVIDSQEQLKEIYIKGAIRSINNGMSVYDIAYYSRHPEEAEKLSNKLTNNTKRQIIKHRKEGGDNGHQA